MFAFPIILIKYFEVFKYSYFLTPALSFGHIVCFAVIDPLRKNYGNNKIFCALTTLIFFGFAERCTKNQSLISSGETNSDLTVSLGCTSLHPNPPSADFVRSHMLTEMLIREETL